ncbi:MAG: hypothetical protein HY925_15085 [Elusimicrobia bacterium]|nr:hypothetical protein [Elusimicrobiota bacterium]
MLRLFLVLVIGSAANGCAWNIKSRSPEPSDATGRPAFSTLGPRTYSLTGKMPPEYRQMAERQLQNAGFSTRKDSPPGENELQVALDFHWSLGGWPRLRLAACAATLNLLPCWGTVNLRVEATATRAGVTRRYEFDHRYRKVLWLLPFALVASKPGAPLNIAELGRGEIEVVESVIAESVSHLTSRLCADMPAASP